MLAASGIQAAAGKWHGCDVKRSGKFFQPLLLRGARAGAARSERAAVTPLFFLMPPPIWRAQLYHTGASDRVQGISVLIPGPQTPKANVTGRSLS